MTTEQVIERQEAWSAFGDDAVGDTAEEVCKNAGLTWNARIEPLFDQRGEKLTHKQRGVFRDDTNECLGIVGKSYHVAQPQRVAGLAHEMTGSGLLEWNKVSVTNNGANAMFNLALPDEVVINGNEPIQGYMTLMNSHDGSGAIKIIPETLRLNCGNQIAMMIASAKQKENGIFSIRHTSRMEDMIAQAIKAINMSNSMLLDWAENAEKMMTVEMDMGDRTEFYIQHLGLKRDDDLIDKVENPFGLATRGKNILKTLADLEGQEQNQIGDMNNTLWQALNVVTDFIDHEWVTTKDGKVNEKRVDSAIYGPGQRMKLKTYKSALQIVGQ